jgi:carboxyl-terminal processing protease
MRKFFFRAFVLISMGFFLLNVAAWALSAIDHSKKTETYKELELFADALATIQSQYVDDAKPKDLIYGALTGMLSGLDPHSQFMTPEEYEELKVDTEGKFGGIGVEITMKDNLITVITPIEGTPAWDAGMQTNDRIVKIDNVVVKNFTLSDAVKRLRGKPGTEVAIVVWREKEGKLHSFKIKRAMIDVKDIKEARILEDHIGYLKLVEFREDTPQELDKALGELRAKGMDSLVIDLRNNPGGLLDKAVQVSERFLAKGLLVVSIKGRDLKQNAEFRASYGKPQTDLPIILLVNGGSASGSEIMAGAFQDHKRAVLLGAKTFGKGSVQTVLPLADGSALKLTTSKYFTPSGRTIHNIGISPDITVDQEEVARPKEPAKDTQKDLEQIFEGMEQEQKPKTDEQKALSDLYVSDSQLARAVDLLKSIKVYKNMISVSSEKP